MDSTLIQRLEVTDQDGLVTYKSSPERPQDANSMRSRIAKLVDNGLFDEPVVLTTRENEDSSRTLFVAKTEEAAELVPALERGRTPDVTDEEILETLGV